MIWVARCAVVSNAVQAIVTFYIVTATKACTVMHHLAPILICCCQQSKVPTYKAFHPSPPPSPSSPILRPLPQQELLIQFAPQDSAILYHFAVTEHFCTYRCVKVTGGNAGAFAWLQQGNQADSRACKALSAQCLQSLHQSTTTDRAGQQAPDLSCNQGRARRLFSSLSVILRKARR